METDLPLFDLLLTFAEIAATVAGFTGIVGVFGRQYSESDPRVDATRLRGMVENALLAVAFALIPLVMAQAGLEDAALWRLASGLLALCWGALTWVSSRRYLALARDGVYRFDPLGRTAYGFSCLAILLLAINSLGVFGGAAPTLYFLGLCSPVVISALLLLRMLGSQTKAR